MLIWALIFTSNKTSDHSMLLLMAYIIFIHYTCELLVVYIYVVIFSSKGGVSL